MDQDLIKEFMITLTAVGPAVQTPQSTSLGMKRKDKTGGNWSSKSCSDLFFLTTPNIITEACPYWEAKNG